MKKLFFLFISIGILSNAIAQDKKLSYSQVLMGGERLINSLPNLNGWADEDNYQLIEREKGTRLVYSVNALTGDKTLQFDFSSWDDQLPEGFSLNSYADKSNDNNYFVFEKDEDLYYFSVKDELFLRITNDEGEEKNATLSPNGKFVAYTKNHNLFVYDVANEDEKILTFDGTDLIYNGWSSWVYYEEIIGRSSRHKAFWWSPNSEKIAFLQFDDKKVPEFPIYHSKGQHGELEKTRYPKAGDPNPFVKFGVVDVNNNNLIWADFEKKADHYVAWPFWSPNGKSLTVQWMNRDQDSLKIYLINTKTGAKTEIYGETQKSWVEWIEDLNILSANKGMIIHSNKSGFAHLYYYDMDGNLINTITEGEWEVKNINLIDEENSKIYFTGWKNESTERHLFRVNFDGTGLTKLTSQSGSNKLNVSPNGKYFYDRFSNINTPSKYLLYNGNGELIREIADSKSEAFENYNLGEVNLFRVKTEDGYNLPVKLFLPPNFDKNKKYPVLISIYGGPDAGTVYNSFPYWMLSFYLAQEGIIFAQVDHRGSGHFGKKGVSEMYRNLGKWEMHDYIAFVKWLETQSYVDTSKIAINGGSYGGYVTCMAMTYGSDYFDYGIAEYSVTDWQLYDNVYTERFMDKPADNPEGYEFGSAINHAANYKGGMLITHGLIDDNVHVQNTYQLINKLEELNKNFELMLYPGERHGIRNKRMHAQTNKMKFLFRNLLNREFSEN